MKKQITLGIGMLLATSLTSAFAMTDSMMKTDGMMKTEGMVKTDGMMKTEGMMGSSNTSMSMNLMTGSTGDDVVSLQTFLEGKGYLNMPVGVSKGYFGKITKMALMQYQSAEGLPSTGYYGPMTRAKMHMAMMSKSDTMMDHGTGAMMNHDSSMGVMVGGAMMVESKDIVDNAVNANNVTTLVAAVKAAGLVDTLKSHGPFTVFAPTNAAFAALPAGTVDTLLKIENKAQLTDILTYHVVAGRYKAADLTDGLVLTTVEGKSLRFTRVNGMLMINGKASVETADVISSNGVTHVINQVLMP
jgi:uncharacterized surface protein with fasciclin (FAS1) repeats